MQLQVPHDSLRYTDLQRMTSKYGVARLGRWLEARMTASTPDEISIWFRQRLLAVLNADGEVHLDTHHTTQAGTARFLDAVLLDNGYDAHFYITQDGHINLKAKNGFILERHVRIAVFRPSGSIECFA